MAILEWALTKKMFYKLIYRLYQIDHKLEITDGLFDVEGLSEFWDREERYISRNSANSLIPRGVFTKENRQKIVSDAETNLGSKYIWSSLVRLYHNYHNGEIPRPEVARAYELDDLDENHSQSNARWIFAKILMSDFVERIPQLRTILCPGILGLPTKTKFQVTWHVLQTTYASR